MLKPFSVDYWTWLIKKCKHQPARPTICQTWRRSLVLCVCEQNKALKSHLLYFPSHCETPHEKAAGLKSTGIITTWRGKKNQKKKKRVGKNHLRSLELLSRINQTILCQFCAEAAIQPVDNVPEEAEHRERKSEMRREKDQARGTAENWGMWAAG